MALVLKCDGRDYAALGNLYAAAGKRAPLAVNRAVRRKGAKALTQVGRAIGQMLKVGPMKVRRHVKGRVTKPGTYVIVARGAMPLKEFQTVQTPAGITVKGIPNEWIEGAEHLAIAFQGKTGAPGNQPGNAVKRLKRLGGKVVYGTGKRRKEGLKSVRGVMVPAAFLDDRAMGEFYKVAAELPAELAHQLWVVTEGLDLRSRAARMARGGYHRRS